MSGHASDYWEDKGLVLLWFSFLAPPAAWAFDQLISYALVKPVCFADTRFTLTAINSAALVLVIAGGLVGRACLLRAREGDEAPVLNDGGRRVDRSYFMALVAIAFNVLVGLLIVFATIPHFVLSPCE
jgi:hypothetical protein